MKFKSLLTCAALFGAALFGASADAATTRHVTFLNNFGELYSYRGQDGVFYVIEAGKGQNADPRVRSGWAAYVWNAQKREWSILNKNDIMELDNVNWSNFLLKSTYIADITPWKGRIQTVEQTVSQNTTDISRLKLDVIRLDGRIDSLTNQTGSITADVAKLKGEMLEQQTKTTELRADVDTLKGRVDTNDVEVASLKGRTTVLEGKVASLEEYTATNDVEIAALKQKDVEQDATIAANAAAAKSYTDAQVGAQSNYVDNVVVPALEGKINDKYEAAVAYTDEVKLELNNRISAEKTDIMTNVGERVRSLRIRLEGEIADTRTFAGNAAVSNAAIALAQSKVFTTNKVDEALGEAKGYADTKKSEAITAANGYTDGQIVSAKAELNETIAGVNTTATNALAVATKSVNDLNAYKTEVTSKFESERSVTTSAIATAKSEAISTAADDATAKANAAKSGAESTAKGYTDGEITTLKSYVNTTSNNVLTAAIGHSDANLEVAKSDATTKVADLKTELTGELGPIAVAKSEAIAAAASDATTKANAAQAAAEATANAKIGAIEKDTVAASISDAAATAKSEAITAAGSAADTKIANKVGELTQATVVAEINAAKTSAISTAADDATTKANTATNVITGKATDIKDALTLYGVRKYAEDKASTAKSEAIADAATDASTKTNELSKALIGTTGDTSSAKTYYGLKKYSDSTFRKISDSYTKTQVYTKTEVDTKLTSALVTASNTAEQVVASKVNAQPKEPKVTTDPDVYELKIKSNTVNTLLPKVNLAEGTEMYVDCDGDRNFKLFLPAEPELLIGLPITVATELPNGVQAAFATKKVVYKLPAKVVCEQPYSKLAVFTVTELETDTNWTPVITNMCIVCTNTADVGVSPKFITVGSHALEGTSLQGGTEFKVVYPTNLSTGATATNDLMTAGSDGIISSTFYYYTLTADLVPTGMAVDGSTLKSWFKIIYKTVNGAATVKQYDVQF